MTSYCDGQSHIQRVLSSSITVIAINLVSLQQVPKESNCVGFHASAPYLLEAPGRSEDRYSSGSVTFYVDSEETFTVSIRARNNEDLVSPPAVSDPVTSDQLRK